MIGKDVAAIADRGDINRQSRLLNDIIVDVRGSSFFLPGGYPTHKHLHRLPWIREGTQLFFITTSTYRRRHILSVPAEASILVQEWRAALPRHGWMTGSYVIMPDHVHFFCSPVGPDAKSLSGFMQAWKQWTSKRMIHECGRSSPVWQEEFFDHLVRSPESARQKIK